MTYKEPLEVLEAVLEKAAVEAGQWITVNGRHMMIPNSQFHPQHGWVNVTHAEIPEGIMGRTPAKGTYHGTKQSDGSKVSFPEGEATHHSISEGGKVHVYNTEQGTKVGEHPASAAGRLPAPTGGAGKPRATVQAGARERASISPTGIVETPKPDTGAPEPRVFPTPTGQGRFSTKPVGE